MLIDVQQSGEKMKMFINIHNQRDVHTGEKLVRKLNRHRVIRRWGNTIPVGIMNAPSGRCDQRCREQYDGTFWEKIVHRYQLETVFLSGQAGPPLAAAFK